MGRFLHASQACLIAIATALASPADASEEKGSQPPPRNILWVYLEDVSGWFSCYGDRVIETPNLDALAARGARFTRYYATAGVCSASRSAVITGMMQTSIGAHHHRSGRSEFRGQLMNDYDRIDLPDGVVPLPVRLREAGYWTFNDGGKDDYNFEWSPHEFYDYVNPTQFGPARFLSGSCLEGKPAGKPFFGQVQLGGGKLGKAAPAVIDPAEVTVPPYYPDLPEVRKEIAHHYDCLLETDRQVGQVIDFLESEGLSDNTLVIVVSDHGMGLHRHKQFLYEGSIRMPLIVAGPSVAKGVVRDDIVTGVDLAAATLAAARQAVPSSMEGRDFLAEDHTPREFVVAARDRCDWTIDTIRAVVTPRYKYLRNYLTDRPYLQSNYRDVWPVSKAVRAAQAAGLLNATQQAFYGDQRPSEELYDLQADPHEVVNLADNPAYADPLREHQRLLAAWIDETGDRGQQPESDAGLRCALQRWGEECVNPEYDRVR
jgi:N-sulfoglucosamine sulfohydrolase